MEYYLGDVLKRSADTLILLGGRIHNLSRMAAAACAKYGIECHILIEKDESGLRGEPQDLVETLSSNMFDAHIHFHSPFKSHQQAKLAMRKLAGKLREDGRIPYMLHNDPDRQPIEAFGYINAAVDIVDQLDELEQEVDVIFCAVGSGTTLAGLLYGLRSLGCDVPVVGVSVGFSEADDLKEQIYSKIDQIADLLDEENPVEAADILVTEAYCAQTMVTSAFGPDHPVTLAARYEGLLIDPFFNSKSIEAAFDYAKLHPESQVMLLNTGNITPSNFRSNAMVQSPSLLKTAV